MRRVEYERFCLRAAQRWRAASDERDKRERGALGDDVRPVVARCRTVGRGVIPGWRMDVMKSRLFATTLTLSLSSLPVRMKEIQDESLLSGVSRNRVVDCCCRRCRGTRANASSHAPVRFGTWEVQTARRTRRLPRDDPRVDRGLCPSDGVFLLVD
jgi:hypothetical protein